jgi:putative polyketide hydroxylase
MAARGSAAGSRHRATELLATYDTERRAIAQLRQEQISARADYKAYMKSRSGAVVPDDAAIELAALPVRRRVQIGVDARPLEPQLFRIAYGLDPTEATLVRPDGYIAWRAIEAPADQPGSHKLERP